MELKKGYKQTEIGIIPKDWKASRIGDYAFVTKLAGFEYTLHFDYRIKGEVIALRALNIKNGKLNLKDVQSIPRETSDYLKRSKLNKGDLVVSYVGTVGEMAVIPENDKFHLAPNVAKIDVDRNKIDPFYLNQYYNSVSGKSEILKLVASTTQSALSMENLRKVYFAFPPALSEQKAIAQVLIDTDQLIQNLKKLIEKKKAIKQGAMQELLTGNKRLKGFTGKWELKKVNQLIDLLTDFDANGSFASVAENVHVNDGSGFSWYVRSTDLENNTGLENLKYVDKSSYEFLKKSSLYGGELLFLKRGDIGKVYLFKMKTKFATLAPNLYLLKLNKLSSSEYLFYYFNSSSGNSQLRAKNASSTLGALYKDDVKSILVPLPPTLKEQQAISQILSDMDSEIEALEIQLKKTQNLKQGMMQELLTGKIRLVNPVSQSTKKEN